MMVMKVCFLFVILLERMLRSFILVDIQCLKGSLSTQFAGEIGSCTSLLSKNGRGTTRTL